MHFLTVDHLRPSKPAIHSAALLEGDLARKEGGGIVGRHLKNCPVSMKSEREKPWCCQRHHTRTGQPLVEKNQGVDAVNVLIQLIDEGPTLGSQSKDTGSVPM